MQKSYVEPPMRPLLLTHSANNTLDCATDSDHFYRADTGADLEAAFRDIAQNLSDLRISK